VKEAAEVSPPSSTYRYSVPHQDGPAMAVQPPTYRYSVPHQDRPAMAVRPPNHTYSYSVIQLALSLVLLVGVSFRAASKTFVQLNLCFGMRIGTPTHTTILSWTKMQGVGNFKNKEYFNDQKWVLIADESIQFGNKKLLLVTAVPARYDFGKGYFTYRDLTPLVLHVSSSWKAEDVADAIREKIAIEQVAYAVSDLGCNLVKAFSTLGVTYIEDINHKFSWMMQRLLEGNQKYLSYAKELSSMRARLSLSKQSRIVPPNQRIMSRYMNLTPLFEWGAKMLALRKTKELTKEEKKQLRFLSTYKKFILDTHALLQALNRVQAAIKNGGFSTENASRCLPFLDALRDRNAQKVKKMLVAYFEENKSKMGGYQAIHCSSDIVESCFGKYKELVKTNKTVGISDLSLCISALMGYSPEEVKSNFGRLKTEDVNKWKKTHIGKTLFCEKRDLMKKSGVKKNV